MNTQNKVSIHYRVLTLILAIIMCVTCVPDLTAFAGSNGKGGADGTLTGDQGWGASNSGWRFYIVDEKGKIKNNYIIDVRDFVWYGYNENAPLDKDFANLTRVAGKVKSIPMKQKTDVWSSIPTAITWDGDTHAKGADFRTWLETEVTNGKKKASNLNMLLYYLWGKDALKMWQTEKSYLVCEPIFRVPIPNGSGGFNNKAFEGTWYGYMRTLADYQDPTGNSLVSFKQIVGEGYELSNDQKEFGLKKANSVPYYLAYSGIGDTGWGIHIYWNQIKSSGDPISTYDIDNNPKTPSTTEKPKNTDKIKNDDKSAGRKDGEVEIVKLYGYAYKRKDWKNDQRRFVKVEQTDNRKNGDNKSITGYFLRKKTTDKICKH